MIPIHEIVSIQCPTEMSDQSGLMTCIITRIILYVVRGAVSFWNRLFIVQPAEASHGFCLRRAQGSVRRARSAIQNNVDRILRCSNVACPIRAVKYMYRLDVCVYVHSL